MWYCLPSTKAAPGQGRGSAQMSARPGAQQGTTTGSNTSLVHAQTTRASWQRHVRVLFPASMYKYLRWCFLNPHTTQMVQKKISNKHTTSPAEAPFLCGIEQTPRVPTASSSDAAPGTLGARRQYATCVWVQGAGVTSTSSLACAEHRRLTGPAMFSLL